MNDINSVLIFLCVFLIVGGVIFWPRRGLLNRLKQARRDKMRILLEDCLKYLHDHEYRNIPCRREDIISNFSSSSEETEVLLNHLKAAGLVRISGKNISLTESGRSHALQIVRIHRLLEKYLADETSLTEAEWHPAAEHREHRLTAEEADKLAARLGNPVYDPHGDPIPTAAGEIPESKGILLPEANIGTTLKVMHIEDEPPQIYSAIISQGIHPGLPLVLQEKEENGYRIEINGEEKLLPAEMAQNITLSPWDPAEKVPPPFRLLSSLKQGESGRVVGISRACRGQQRRRLMDLGVVPGSVISAEMKSVGGDPTAYLIRGALIALRRQQSDQIYIEENNRR
jgi:DtxR family Mn-dependent transcriptional regulator